MNFTNNIFLNVLLTVLYALLIIITFNLANIYYLRKLKINMWALLGIAIGTFVIATVLVAFMPNGLWHLIPLAVSLTAFMWFLDAKRRDRNRVRKAEKTIVNKPKPNPRRAKLVTNNSESSGKSQSKSVNKSIKKK